MAHDEHHTTIKGELLSRSTSDGYTTVWVGPPERGLALQMPDVVSASVDVQLGVAALVVDIDYRLMAPDEHVESAADFVYQAASIKLHAANCDLSPEFIRSL